MIRKPLILKMCDAATMQRWNDKIRPVELRELDKQAHKMIIAYVLGKFEEARNDFDWVEIIEGGIFEFLQRLIITDLKPQIFYKIMADRDKYRQLNGWVYSRLAPIISPLGEDLCRRFVDYFSQAGESVNRRVLRAAHFYATKWEFDIIERANPEGYEIAAIKSDLQRSQERYYDLGGIQHLALYARFRNFIDLCGQLRFQQRWSHLPMVPKTSVIGHMLLVAITAYLFSLETGACSRRRVNNFLTGLFHDLPEVLTRDIISPVKNSIEGLSELIKEYEKEQMEKEVYSLLPREWHPQMRMFTESEFKSIVTVGGTVKQLSSDEITREFNRDEFDPRDGELIRAADHLAAFVEAYVAIKNGITSQELEDAKLSLKNLYKHTVIAGVNVGEIFADFE